MITGIGDLRVQVVELRHGDVAEQRLELVRVSGGDPLVSLPLAEAQTLAWRIDRHIQDTHRQRRAASSSTLASGSAR